MIMSKKIYFAPLEGITDALYRQLHSKYFGGVCKYFAPFISPTSDRVFSLREIRDILPENNAGIDLVPQVLAKDVDNFLWAADYIHGLGYNHVNLNLGCPSGTVVAKGKGAGMLTDAEMLDKFLDGIFSSVKISISVKTRIGTIDGNEFPALLEVFNKYPISELIIHPRTRKQMYGGSVSLDAFDYAYKNSRLPLSYNGDIKSSVDAEAIENRFPNINSVMIGRGLVSSPYMFCADCRKKTIKEFSDELTNGYLSLWGSERHVLSRMKEIWGLMMQSFDDKSGRYSKNLLKSGTLSELNSAIMSVLTDLNIRSR